jgi:hypothetical protein
MGHITPGEIVNLGEPAITPQAGLFDGVNFQSRPLGQQSVLSAQRLIIELGAQRYLLSRSLWLWARQRRG